MATTTPNFGWPVPTSTDLVKDGATAIEALGDSIDASLLDLKGGTSGQVLAKNSNTDMDFIWVTDAAGDITGVTAGTGISGGGTSGTVTVTNSMATAIDAKGDLIGGTGADTFARLAVGTNGQVLTADSAETTGLKWASASSGLTLIKTQTIGSAVSSVTVSSAFNSTYDNYRVTITGGTSSGNEFYLTFGSASSNYKYTQLISGWSNTLLTFGSSSASNIQAFRASTGNQNTYMDIMSPNLTKITAVTGASPASGQFHQVYGVLDDTTAYTAFTLTTGSGTFTGGEIRVYGYQNS
jgi:hypothetical protein